MNHPDSDARVVPLDVATASAVPEPEGCCLGAAGEDPNHHHGYISAKDNYLRRLRRIEGQARGLQRMVEEEKYCIDILTQISALNSALENVALGLLDDHLRHCVVDAAREGGDEAETKLKEASDAVRRLVKS